MHPLLRRLAAGSAVLSALGLSACAPALVVKPADDPANPACAMVMLRLPEQVGGFDKRPTSSQSTAAWGDPAAAILRCGMPKPAPTTDPCVVVDEVDWISARADEGTWRFITYGREPAVEVLVSQTEMAGATALAEVASAVKSIEATGGCVDAQDAEQVDEASPAP